MVEFKKCRRCQANRVGFEWIQNNIHDAMASNKDPRNANDIQNILSGLKVEHARLTINKDGKPPCSLCLAEYGQMINDAVYSFKKTKLH